MKRLLAIVLAIFASHLLLAQADTLKNRIPVDSLPPVANQLDSIQNSFQSRTDSVQHAYQHTAGKITSLRDRYQHKVDSLITLNQPTGPYTAKVDSLNTQLVSVQQKATGKITSIKQEATGKLNNLPLTPDMQARAADLTSKIDGLNLSPVSAPGMPGLTGGINGTLPEIPGMPNTGNLEVPGSDKIPGLNGTNGVSDITKNIDGVSSVTEQVGSIQQAGGQVTQTAQDVKQVDKLAESQAGKIAEVKALQDQAGSLPANPLGSEKETKEQLVSQARKVAVDHFAGKQEQLKQAMDQMSKYKQKYESVQSIKELPKRPPNAMKGKPLRERVVPGLTLQAQHQGKDWQADFYLSAGYRLSGRITAGLGWNQRWGYHFGTGKFRPGSRVFGPRAYGEFKLKKGFVLRAETEMLNTYVPPNTQPARVDNPDRQWVWGALAGLKKEYTFIGRVKGNVQLLYNIFDPHNKSPYGDRLIARMGFEYSFKSLGKQTARKSK